MESVITVENSKFKVVPLHNLIVVSVVDINKIISKNVNGIHLSKPMYFNDHIYKIGKIEIVDEDKCRINVKKGDKIYYGNLGTYNVELPDEIGKFQKYTFIKYINVLGSIK